MAGPIICSFVSIALTGFAFGRSHSPTYVLHPAAYVAEVIAETGSSPKPLKTFPHAFAPLSGS
jgi:hypothetical protein